MSRTFKSFEGRTLVTVTVDGVDLSWFSANRWINARTPSRRRAGMTALLNRWRRTYPTARSITVTVAEGHT